MPHFVALWTRPETDVEGFEEHYRTVHTPLCAGWPKVRSRSVTKATGSPTGGEPRYHLVFMADFASQADLDAAMKSEEMGRTMEDLGEIDRRFGVRPEVLVGSKL